MRSSIVLLSFVLVNVASVMGRPIWSSRRSLETRAFAPTTDYSKFQISTGVAGDAKAKAEKVFVAPFAGVDLTTVSAADLKSLNIMRELAEDAETDLFNPQIAAASGAAAKALQVGKIQNKVLKLTAEVQSITIKIAQAKAKGASTSSLETDLATEQKKLNTNIATDVKSKGAASQAASGTVTPRSS